MGKSLAFSNAILKLMLQGIAAAGLAVNTEDDPIETLYVALHTANPGSAGTQATSEAAYPGYERVAVPRTALGFSVVSNVARFFNSVTFPPAEAGANETETYFSVGTDETGAGEILYSGAIGAPIVVTPTVVPFLDALTTTITET